MGLTNVLAMKPGTGHVQPTIRVRIVIMASEAGNLGPSALKIRTMTGLALCQRPLRVFQILAMESIITFAGPTGRMRISIMTFEARHLAFPAQCILAVTALAVAKLPVNAVKILAVKFRAGSIRPS